MPEGVPVAIGPSQSASELHAELSLAAAELGVSLEFHSLRCRLEDFAASNVRRREGEVLVVNCGLQTEAVAEDSSSSSSSRRGGVRERCLQVGGGGGESEWERVHVLVVEQVE